MTLVFNENWLLNTSKLTQWDKLSPTVDHACEVITYFS
jgi:hypothetical protein